MEIDNAVAKRLLDALPSLMKTNRGCRDYYACEFCNSIGGRDSNTLIEHDSNCLGIMLIHALLAK